MYKTGILFFFLKNMDDAGTVQEVNDEQSSEFFKVKILSNWDHYEATEEDRNGSVAAWDRLQRATQICRLEFRPL